MANPHNDLFWERRQQEGAEIFRISGSFCLLSPDKLDEFREVAKGLDTKRCILDMREVPYMDSAGMGILALIARYAVANDAALVVVPSAQVRKLITSTGMDRALLFADSIPAALDAKAEPPAE